MKHLIAGNDTLRFADVITAGVHVPIKAGKVAARYLDSDSVTRGKVIAGCHWTQRKFIHLFLFHPDGLIKPIAVTGAEDGFVQIIGFPVGIHIQQFYRKIGVFSIGGYV